MRLLREIGVIATFVGYESGSDRMLRAMRKGTTAERSLAATSLLARGGIEVVGSGIVLGAEGEDTESLRETVRFVQELKKLGNTCSVTATPLVPLPGSLTFHRLLEVLRKRDEAKHRELASADVLDIPALVDLWVHYMCAATWNEIMAVREEIGAIIPPRITLFDPRGQDPVSR